MIRYHGTPITPNNAALAILTARHGMVSFARPDQIALVAEVCQSFVIDNGAFTAWRGGKAVDADAYADFVREWLRHPGFDWCLIPDVIDGDWEANRDAVAAWPLPRAVSVPVWHLHEPVEWLAQLAREWPRVALGSSGQWSDPGSESWWERMNEAMPAVCDADGRPVCKLHGLRMMDPTIFSAVPLASVDSCGVARNIGIDSKWDRGYLRGMSKGVRAQVLADRFERHASATVWRLRTQQLCLDLLG